jgi:hypothetical protein
LSWAQTNAIAESESLPLKNVEAVHESMTTFKEMASKMIKLWIGP